MNALQSYLRHLIVTGLVLGIEKFKLPVQGADEAANVIALAVIGTATWLVTKYAGAWARRIGLLPMLAAGLFLLPGCAEYPITFKAQTDQGVLGYSAKGMTIEVDARSRK